MSQLRKRKHTFCAIIHFYIQEVLDVLKSELGSVKKMENAYTEGL